MDKQKHKEDMKRYQEKNRAKINEYNKLRYYQKKKNKTEMSEEIKQKLKDVEKIQREKNRKPMSDETKEKLRNAYKQRQEDKNKMGLFKKKPIETKTFIEGQQQQPTAQQLPPMPPPPLPQPPLPPPPQPPIDYNEDGVDYPQDNISEELQPQPIKLQPGFYYWIDEFGDLCSKPMRR